MEKNHWQQLTEIPANNFHFGRDVIKDDGVRSYKIRFPRTASEWANTPTEIREKILTKKDEIHEMTMEQLENVFGKLNGHDITIDVVESARTGTLKIVEESVHSV